MEDILITKKTDNVYELETNGHIYRGFYKKINKTITEFRLDYWYDKNTKRAKGKSNKLFNHTEKWFCYMLDKYLKEA